MDDISFPFITMITLQYNYLSHMSHHSAYSTAHTYDSIVLYDMARSLILR